jgi:hypothetical protein
LLARHTGNHHAATFTLGIRDELNGNIQWLVDHMFVGERRDAELLQGVVRIGDELAEENVSEV